MRRWQAALRLLGVGWYVGTCIVLGVYAGLWLDSKFNTKPILVMTGLMMGLIFAGYGVYRMIRPLMTNKQNKEDD